MGNKTNAIVLRIIYQYDEKQSLILFGISYYSTKQMNCNNITNSWIEFIKMYIFNTSLIDKKYLYDCTIFRLNIDLRYLWCDFYTDKSKTPFECLV